MPKHLVGRFVTKVPKGMKAHLCAVLPLVVDHHSLTVHLGGAPGLVVVRLSRGAGLVADALVGEGEHTGASLLSAAVWGRCD